MSDSQTAWSIIWKHAAGSSKPGAPFEIGEVSPEVAGALKIPVDKARRLISGLLTELDRAPEGKRYFTREGNAIVPLPEFTSGHSGSPLDAYPYEL